MTEESIKLTVGDIAPDFTLNNQKGESISLSKVLKSGKKVLLIFYPGDDTPGCTAQLCGIRDIYKEYQDLDVAVYGLNHANEKSHQKFIDKHNYQFDILVDTDKKVAIEYGQIKKFFAAFVIKRAAYLIDTNGKILFIHQGQQDNSEIIKMLKAM
jgi:thioredoxin-dependent peroxiredoxin